MTSQSCVHTPDKGCEVERLCFMWMYSKAFLMLKSSHETHNLTWPHHYFVWMYNLLLLDYSPPTTFGSRKQEIDWNHKLVLIHTHTLYTIDREIFTIKNFSPLGHAAKIKSAKIFLWWIIRARVGPVTKIKCAKISYTKKTTRKFPNLR